MKTLINITLLSFAMLFMSMLNAQDTVKKKNKVTFRMATKIWLVGAMMFHLDENLKQRDL